jgi:tRNA-dihydrouridine synthase A
MKEVTEIPVTVKHRIGIDDLDKYEDMKRFVEVVAESGCTRFSVHARKAWLKGLSPKENRTVPPLRYEDVYRLKRELPHLFVEINGGVRDLESIREHLNAVDAVMVGRAAYDNPWILARVDSSLYGETDPSETRADAVLGILNYAERICSEGIRLHALTRHLHHLFHGLRGSRQWKQHLSTVCTRTNAGPESLREGLRLVPEAHE